MHNCVKKIKNTGSGMILTKEKKKNKIKRKPLKEASGRTYIINLGTSLETGVYQHSAVWHLY